MISGFAIAAALAIPLGLLVGPRHLPCANIVDPVIRSLYPIPGIAWIPLAILWFGLGNTAVIFVVFIAEFFPLYFNTEAGRPQHQSNSGRRRALLWRQTADAVSPCYPAGLDPLHHHRHAHRARRCLAHDRCRRNAGVGDRHRVGSDGVAVSVPRH